MFDRIQLVFNYVTIIGGAYFFGRGLHALLRASDGYVRYTKSSLGFLGLGFGLDALGRLLDAGDTLIGIVCLWGGIIAMWTGLIRIFRVNTKFPEVGRDEWEALVRENQDRAAR